MRNRLAILSDVVLALAMSLAVALVWAESKESPKPASPTVIQARAQFRLAELNLQKVRKMNQRVANLVSADVVAEYRDDVEIAKARLAAVERDQGDNPFQVWIRTAEAALKAAEGRLKSAQAVRQKVAGVFDDLDLERMQLRVELARLQLERAKTLVDKPPHAQLQWQIGVLADEVQRLREQARHAAPSGGVAPAYPLWWHY